MIINICLSCDENYSKYAAVVIASVLTNANNSDNLNFYILDGNISQESKNKISSLNSMKECHIEFVQINEEDFDDYKNISNHNYISIATYYRLKLASLLPNVDKIIYLDCDIVVCQSLETLFNTELGNNIFGGVLDIDLDLRNNSNYINAGVLLMDLAKVREQGIEDKFLEYAKKNWQNIQLGDQGIINDVLRDKIKNIANEYNVQDECFIRRSDYTKHPAIIHFIGKKKPWHKDCWSFHKGLFYKYLQLTPWKMNEKDLFLTRINLVFISFYTWFIHRPFFYLQKKFWNAVIKTYFMKNNEET